MAKTKPRNPLKKIDSVKIRMYCIGTGDCFVIKFCSGRSTKFTMMIDCGSCKGDTNHFTPYVEDLVSYVDNHIDLLVVTHEHNDHVNGFAKCEEIFRDKNFKIDEAWFAWTENPADPDGQAGELLKKRKKMRTALKNAIQAFNLQADTFKNTMAADYFKPLVEEGNVSFMDGLETLKSINLSEDAEDNALPGMTKIKDILEKKGSKIRYLAPGQIVMLNKLPGFRFYVLGPPHEREYIFKDGKEGTDVYKRRLTLYETALAAGSFLNIGVTDIRDKDIPFGEEYLINRSSSSVISSIGGSTDATTPGSTGAEQAYNDPKLAWRKIDNDWLSSAGSLALRLNSHINNTSLVLAIEAEDSGKVMLLPGDAEYGSWESWHDIAKWDKKGKGGTHLVQDLLSRTVFYKVGHHLSYNGTALKKGILMMESPDLVSMATLDLLRIAPGWKSTMPNKFLLHELIRRCQGKLFIMNNQNIDEVVVKQIDPEALGKKTYESAMCSNGKDILYKQYNLHL
jgi:beta-lactamase superfamily II metal-dependent hydrolase